MVTEPTEAAMSQPCPPGKRWSKSQQRFVQDLSFKKKNRKGKTTDGQAIGLDEQLKRPQYIAKTDDISSSLNLGGYASGFESDHWSMSLSQEPSPEPCSAKSRAIPRLISAGFVDDWRGNPEAKTNIPPEAKANMPLPQEPSPEPFSITPVWYVDDRRGKTILVDPNAKRGPESRGKKKHRGTKIFIRGLGKDTDKQQLKDFFDSLGAPLCFF